MDSFSDESALGDNLRSYLVLRHRVADVALALEGGGVALAE